MSDRPVGVLLMTYGSPASLDDVPAYLGRVRGGRMPDPDLAAEFTRRYRAIGGSPLVSITLAQAAALEERLGPGFRCAAGMRFSEPSIETAIRELHERGARRVVGIVLSPQWSPLLMGGYGRAIDAAQVAIGRDAPDVEIADAWYREPAFVGALGQRIREALARLDDDAGLPIPVLLTAHSLPRRVAEQEPDYLAQLRETASSVASAAGLASDRWTFCWQSAGHQPGEWMKPDFADLMPELAAAGARSVVVAPVQFLADHLEVLYDVDIGAREQAERCGLAFARIESLNTDSGLIEALAQVARRTGAPVGVAVSQALRRP